MGRVSIVELVEEVKAEWAVGRTHYVQQVSWCSALIYLIEQFHDDYVEHVLGFFPTTGEFWSYLDDELLPLVVVGAYIRQEEEIILEVMTTIKLMDMTDLVELLTLPIDNETILGEVVKVVDKGWLADRLTADEYGFDYGRLRNVICPVELMLAGLKL